MSIEKRTFRVPLSDEQCERLEHECAKRGINPNFLVLELLRGYLEDVREKSWDELCEPIRFEAQARGYKPEDVQDWIEEYRAEIAATRE